jgi:hypothetical protein
MVHTYSKLHTCKGSGPLGFSDPLKPLLEGPNPLLWPIHGANSDRCKGKYVTLPWCWYRLLPDKDYKEAYFPYNREIYLLYLNNQCDYGKEDCPLHHYLPAGGPKRGWVIYYPCGCGETEGTTDKPTEEGICQEDLDHLGHSDTSITTCSGGVYDPDSKTFFKVPAKNLLLNPIRKRKRRTGGTRTSLTDKKHFRRGRPKQKPERPLLLNDLH